MHENGAEVNAQNDYGFTALMCAAMQGKTATAKFLIEELKADKTLKDNSGKTAADIALQQNHPITFAAIDPAAAAKEEFEKAMEEAEVVDVISTRFQMAKSEKAKVEASRRSTSKQRTGRPTTIVRPLRDGQQREEGAREGDHVGRVIVFNPNTGQFPFNEGRPGGRQCHLAAQLAQGARPRQEDGRPLRANNRKRRFSEMQEAEASMAEDKGVPVVRLDCSEVKGYADLSDLEKMAGWKELMALAPEA